MSTFKSEIQILYGIASGQMKTNLCPTRLTVLSLIALNPGITRRGVKQAVGCELNRLPLQKLEWSGLIKFVVPQARFIPRRGPKKPPYGMEVTEEGLELLKGIMIEGVRQGRGEG